MKAQFDTFMWGLATGLSILFLLVLIYVNITRPAIFAAIKEEAKMSVWRDAYANGVAQKEITEDDKVIYRWIETHKAEFIEKKD